MQSGTHLWETIAHDEIDEDRGGPIGRPCTLERSRLEPACRPATVSPLANCIGPDALLAKHMLSLADDAQAAHSLDLAARFVELALELLDEAYR